MIPRRVELELDNLRNEYMEDPVTEKYIYNLLDEIENLKKQKSSCDAGFVTVKKEVKKFGVMTLCRLMDDCLPEEIETESDMQILIDKLWPALVFEHQIDSVSSIVGFLEENAPVYDDWQKIDEKHCCEITLLKERERLNKAAKEVLK